MRRSSVRFVALAVAAGVVLSACSSTDRMAAPVEEEVVSEQVTESEEEAQVEPDAVADADAAVGGEQEAALEPDDEVSDETTSDVDDAPEGERVQAIVRGVRICVINERTMRDGKPALLNVKFTRADRVSRDSTYVLPGEQICGEAGYTLSLDPGAGGTWVHIGTMYDDTPIVGAIGYNEALGKTTLEVIFDYKRGVEQLSCLLFASVTDSDPDSHRMDVMDDSINRFTIQQLPDSNSFKEYTITVSDGESRKRCRYETA